MAKSFLNHAGYPLGLRNNNPGNIRTGDSWRGMIGSNQGFCVFSDVSWGIRAMAVDLAHKIAGGYNTIAKIITRYAPPEDNNDTEAYIESVIASTGFTRNQVLFATETTLRKFIRAIMNVEVGEGYAAMITDADINEGISLMDSVYVSPAAAGGITIVGAALLGLAFYLVYDTSRFNRRIRAA